MKVFSLPAMLVLVRVLPVNCPPKEEHTNGAVSFKAESGAPGMQVFLLAGKGTGRRGVFHAGGRRRWRLIPDRVFALADEQCLDMRYPRKVEPRLTGDS